MTIEAPPRPPEAPKGVSGPTPRKPKKKVNLTYVAGGVVLDYSRRPRHHTS